MARSTSPVQQTVTFTAVTVAGVNLAALLDAMQELPGLSNVRVVPQVTEPPGEANRDRLIDLVTWVAGEDAKRRLGLPSQWDQRDWLTRDGDLGNACGTACCIAGKVALDDGGEPVFKRWDEAGDTYVEIPLAEVESGISTGTVQFPNGGRASASEYARAALGLTDDQARDLFAGGNSYDSILAQVRRLLAGSEPVTVRRLRDGCEPDCGMGESCDLCYEDVQADTSAPAPEPAPAPTRRRRKASAWDGCNRGEACDYCYEDEDEDVPF